VKQGLARRKTQDQFIIDAQTVHGNKYDYSKVDYETSQKNVIIICKEHGEFTQKTNNHLLGKGCSKCAGRHQPTSDEFIVQAKQIHGENTYDYSRVIYKDCKTNVRIICPKEGHGEFLQAPSTHYKGGCPICGRESTKMKLSKTQDAFICDATKIHGEDKYDYSQVVYENCKSIVTIICHKEGHGQFDQMAQVHLTGAGCPKCGGCYKRNREEFIQDAKQIHGDAYDYSQVEYKTCKDHVIIVCQKDGHGSFNVTPDSHINNKSGCKHCYYQRTAERMSDTQEEFVEKANNVHGDTYDYSKVVYIDSQQKVVIICKKHDEFLQAPSSHIQGIGCPFCTNKTEGILHSRIKTVYPTIVPQFRADWCKKQMRLPFDFCIEEYKIIIELDGAQHFRQVRNWTSPEEQLKNDIYKQNCANDNGYSVIRLLQEDVFYNKYNWFSELCQTINYVIVSGNVENYYLCKNNEYAIYPKFENILYESE